MREIKFRHYFPSTGVVTAGHDVMTIILTSTGKEDFWKDAVWMQYTGLKDKNGKEIYEGDIIVAYNAEQTGIDDEGGEIMANVTGKVIYEDGAFHYDGHSAGFIPLSYNIDDIEVIGNIYQNTELLKK